MKKIKLGIIGTGLAWEKLHFPALKRLKENFEITAICNENPEKAKKAADELGLGSDKIFTCHDRMLKTADIEAVDIMVPISENYEVTKAAIEAGKHIIAEKPFASSIKGAMELLELSQKHKVKVLVAENFRYTEENRIMKEIILSKKLGNVVYFIDNNVTEFQKDMLGDNFAAKEWRQHPDFKGGIFLDSGVHHIARLRFLFGDVMKLAAAGRPSGTDFCEYSCINALLEFKDHITGHYAFYNIGKETQAPLVGLRIFFTAGEIYLEDKYCGCLNVSHKDGNHEVINFKPEEGYYNELLNFYNVVANGEEIISTPEKAIGDMKIIFEILDSIHISCKS